MTFGERIAALRKEKDMKQNELASQLGIGPVQVSRYEKDLITPSVEVAARIAKALGVSLDHLVNGVEELPANSPAAVNQKLQQFDRLSEKDQEYVLAVLDAFATKAKLQEILGQ
ncbi:helix-turn-helix transcriptional regulator [uncultured Chitinophaga sp.]|uniref:helix-turn-helix domain-containing protein n=1 Tax=uncultured Chitinophaga sp. TaxID=339340 RepID=UPI0025E86ABD|nr:helix-turn-helix transcriptional regulator [uncultured Chitinophaga sp.]